MRNRWAPKGRRLAAVRRAGRALRRVTILVGPTALAADYSVTLWLECTPAVVVTRVALSLGRAGRVRGRARPHRYKRPARPGLPT